MGIESTAEPSRENGRDRRKRLTRQALRSATLELGLEHGLAAVSVEAIAERAGVSTRTFFNYFETKEDAGLLALFAVSETDLASLSNGPPDTGWRDLTRLFADDVDRATDDGLEFASFLKLQEQNPALAARQLAIFARFEARISAALVTRLGGGPDAQVRAPLMVGCCLTVVRVALQRWTLERRRGPISVHVERGLAVIEPAFRATPDP